MGGGAGILIVLVVCAVIAFMALMWRAEKQRRQALAALAREWGFRFWPDRDRSHDDEYAQFEIFRRGHSRYASNRLEGSIELDTRPHRVHMGDFTYTTGSGKDQTTHRISYLIIELPWGDTPDLLIRREGVFDKIAGALGFDDIDFESAQFSRRFYVKSSDKRFAYDVIDPRMMEFLLAHEPPMVDLERGSCCVADDGSRWSPEQFRRHLDWVQRFFEHWPEHVKAAFDDKKQMKR